LHLAVVAVPDLDDNFAKLSSNVDFDNGPFTMNEVLL